MKALLGGCLKVPTTQRKRIDRVRVRSFENEGNSQKGVLRRRSFEDTPFLRIV